jgi:hypothetical protein
LENQPLHERLDRLQKEPAADLIAHHLRAIEQRIAAAERRYLANPGVARRLERALGESA